MSVADYERVEILEQENERLRAKLALLEQPVNACVRGPTERTVPPPPSILQQADAIAGQDRSRDYGHPYENHRRIAVFWSEQIAPKLKEPLTPSEVALMMVGLKLARLINSPSHQDSCIDIAGYIKCWDMIQQWGREHGK